MKTKSYSYSVYEFKELGPEAQEAALEKLRDCNTDYGWYESTMDDWKEKLTKLGYMDAEIHFTGFCSQGDGANFTASVDFPVWSKAHKAGRELAALHAHLRKDGWMEANVKKTSNHYEHEYTIAGSVNIDYGSEKADEQANQLEDWITEDARKLSREIYRALEKEYDYLTTDAAIKETIEANEWTFDARGNLDNI